jgi:ADP-ribose pyrophosphatase
VTDSQTAFVGRRFRVERREHEICGTQHTFEVVVHSGAAVILPVLDDGRLVFIHNYRVSVQQELLEIPAGTLDPGEDPAVCAARELAEETGYRAQRIVPLVSFYSSPGILSERMHVFLATELTPGPTAHDAGEEIRPAVLALPEALDAIQQGRIVDGKTILTILYYDRYVRGKGGAR